MTVSLTCPQDENPLSYARVDGEWLRWYETAHRLVVFTNGGVNGYNRLAVAISTEPVAGGMI